MQAYLYVGIEKLEPVYVGNVDVIMQMGESVGTCFQHKMYELICS